MHSFKHHIEQQEYTEAIIKLAYVMEYAETHSADMLTEKLSVALSKHKTPGLIEYIAKFTSSVGKLVLAALKGDKKKVKSIASGLDPSSVIDFLLKLDMATLHLLTMPIHTIDAITGWDIIASLRDQLKSSETHMDKMKKAYQDLKMHGSRALKKSPEKFRAIKDLGKLIPIK